MKDKIMEIAKRNRDMSDEGRTNEFLVSSSILLEGFEAIVNEVYSSNTMHPSYLEEKLDLIRMGVRELEILQGMLEEVTNGN